MNKRKSWLFAFFLALFFSLWSCSSTKAPKTVITRPPSPGAADQPSSATETKEPAEVKEEAPPLPKNEEFREEIAQEDSGLDQESSNEKVDGATLLEDALNTYQEAIAALDKDDSAAALQALDEAYGLILRAQLPPDSPLCQEKNDLRLLIAQKIQQIYASRLVVIGDNHKTIPLVENKEVNDEIVSFQTREKRLFEEAYERSGLFREMIVEELKKEGLPEELSWLPLIESWYKVKALSRARALGLWQFISSTGYRFGLKRDRWVDERMDPLKATRAAVKYLAELHSFFGDWTTALASYNCGEIRVQNVIRTQRIDYPDNFWDLYRQLPYETARFVPRLIAALLIITNPEKYGFNLPQPLPALRFETITVNRPFKLAALAGSLGIEAAELAFLNPELRHESTPAYDYELRVPPGLSEKAVQATGNISRWIPPEAQYTWHYVRSGETLSTIARRYRTSVGAIARLNGLRSVNFIRPGQRLKIPGRGAAVTADMGENKAPSDIDD